jgi:ribosomal protein S18 acetylase RimI-like enzyme
MIVRALDDRLQLVTQPDHARLAGEVMARAVALADRPRRESILRAVSRHDDGWVEEDEAPVVDPATGELLDFVHLPAAARQRVWPRAVARLADDPWAAALVAHHAVTVYDRFRGDPEWARFFDGLAASRDALAAASGLPFEELVADYAFVRLGDLVSLTFCAGWSDEQRFAEWTVRRDGARVVVAPDPFGGATVALAVDAREIERRPYASHEEVRVALAAAERCRLRGLAAGPEVDARVELRAATPDDADAVAEIWHLAWRDGHLGHVPPELLPHRSLVHFRPRVPPRLPSTTVATSGDVVIGFVTLHDDELEQIFVLREARGSGAAQALLGHAETALGERHDTAWLAVAAGNARARRFYERHGWHDAGGYDYPAEIPGGTLPVPTRRYEKRVRAERPV